MVLKPNRRVPAKSIFTCHLWSWPQLFLGYQTSSSSHSKGRADRQKCLCQSCDSTSLDLSLSCSNLFLFLSMLFQPKVKKFLERDDVADQPLTALKGAYKCLAEAHKVLYTPDTEMSFECVHHLSLNHDNDCD